MSDLDLLRSWRSEGRAGDFAELVRRHSGLVLGVARRQLGEELAEDTAQTVFALLARKAPEARCLSAWLHRVTVLQCHSAVRRKYREKRARQVAAEWAEQAQSPENDPMAEVIPHLDAALQDLGDRDRELLLLRYSEGLSFSEAAARTGRGEAALRQQSGRALEKLSQLLRRRGVAVPAAALASGLGGMLGPGGVPAARAVELAAEAIQAAGALGGFALFMFFLRSLQPAKAVAAGALTAAAISALPLIWQERRISAAERDAAAAALTAPASSASDAAATGNPQGNAQLAIASSTGVPAAAPVNSPDLEPSGDLMEYFIRVMNGEVRVVMSDWVRSDAWLEARRTGMALSLPPQREREMQSALENLLLERLRSDSDHEGNLKQYEQKRAAWFQDHLNPDELARWQTLESERRGRLIQLKAESAVSSINSRVELTGEQKTRLLQAATAKARAAVEAEGIVSSITFGAGVGMEIQPPVEEKATALIARVLDPAQLVMWEEEVRRNRTIFEDLPRRAADRMLFLAREHGLETSLTALVNRIAQETKKEEAEAEAAAAAEQESKPESTQPEKQ